MSHDDHETHHVNYVLVFFALCGFTALSVVFDVMSFDNHAITIVLVMAVAVAKALCVMMFFMHLKFEGNWKYVLLAPTTILAIGLPPLPLANLVQRPRQVSVPLEGVHAQIQVRVENQSHTVSLRLRAVTGQVSPVAFPSRITTASG